MERKFDVETSAFNFCAGDGSEKGRAGRFHFILAENLPNPPKITVKKQTC
jgi:hypothetical protein